MYRIMIMTARGTDGSLTYKSYMEALTSGGNKVWETDDETELDTKIETLLNESNYTKTQLVPVKMIDYTVSASIVDSNSVSE